MSYCRCWFSYTLLVQEAQDGVRWLNTCSFQRWKCVLQFIAIKFSPYVFITKRFVDRIRDSKYFPVSYIFSMTSKIQPLVAMISITDVLDVPHIRLPLGIQLADKHLGCFTTDNEFVELLLVLSEFLVLKQHTWSCLIICFGDKVTAPHDIVSFEHILLTMVKLCAIYLP